MDKRYKRFLVVILCALTMVAGCEKKASDEIDFGAVKNSTYRNEYFGLNLALPADWSVHDQKTMNRMTDAGKEMFAGDDKKMKAMLKASELQTVNLFAASKHPMGAPVPSNPTIACVAERVTGLPGIKRGKDYLFHAKKMMESGQVRFQFPKEISTEKFNGMEFDVLHAVMSVGPMKVQQKYYASVMKGYALLFVASYTMPDEELALQKIVESASFKN